VETPSVNGEVEHGEDEDEEERGGEGGEGGGGGGEEVGKGGEGGEGGAAGEVEEPPVPSTGGCCCTALPVRSTPGVSFPAVLLSPSMQSALG